MRLLKVSSPSTQDSFIFIPSSDMQDVMFAVERIYQGHRTPKVRGDKPRFTDPLVFDVYGTASFKGYTTNGEEETITCDIVTSLSGYDVPNCRQIPFDEMVEQLGWR